MQKQNMHVGLDIGYSSVKLAFGSGGEPEVVRLPVGAGPIEKCGLSMSGEKDVGAGHQVVINGQPWIAGLDPSRLQGFVSSMDESYPQTDEYRALFYAALCELGATTVDSLVTGLPVSHFMELGVREKLEKLMLGRHYIREDLTVEVKDVRVVPQPAGAYGAYVRDSAFGKEKVKVEPGMSVLVVDSGHYSLDWCIFEGALKLESSGSTSSAGEVVVRRAADKLSQQLGIRVRQARLQEAVLIGARPLVVGGREIEFWPALHDVAGEIVRDNLKALKGSVRSVADIRGVDLVIVGGGGARLFQGALTEAFPESQVVCLRESITSNARGFYHYAASAMQKKAAPEKRATAEA